MEHHLAIFLPNFKTGGVERMIVNLARGITTLGNPVDLVVRNARSSYLIDLPPSLKLVELDTIHPDVITAASIYLKDSRPRAILVSKEKNCVIAIKARERSRIESRIVMRVPVHITERLRQQKIGPLKKWKKRRKSRNIYKQADSLIAVSSGVASDISNITGTPLEKIHTIPNPVVTPDMEALAGKSIEHDWFTPKDKPVLVGLGRLDHQKNFEALIRSVGKVREQIDCRLLILGEGRWRPRLERLIKALGMTASVQLPGFVENPYPYLARADLFVLSSLWEGSPNALSEALALGVPVVSTDCESGPREVLQNGKYGPLVSVGDTNAMASAIIETLSDPPTAEFLKSAVNEYNVDDAAKSYLKVLFG